MRILRHVVVVVASATLAIACKKKPLPVVVVDAGMTPVAVASASGSARRSGRPPPPLRAHRDAGLPVEDAGPPPPPLPLATDTLELVAIGKTWTSKILWLQAHGDRVWLSGRNLDAFADGDGPLVKGPDPLVKLDYKPGVHSMHVVGVWPHLFLLRTRNVIGRMESPEATAFVYTADAGSGTWTKAKPLPMDGVPWAFLPFRDGALLVYSQNEGNAAPMYFPPGPGTSFAFVGADGSVGSPKLDVPHWFMAWAASADNGVLSMIGTTAQTKVTKLGDMAGGDGIELVRVAPEGTKVFPIQKTFDSTMIYRSRVVERAGATLVAPPTDSSTEAWKPTSLSHFTLDGDRPKARTVSGAENCRTESSEPVGDAIYTIRSCFAETDFVYEVARLRADGTTERLALASLVGKTAKEGGGFRIATTPAEKARGLGCAPTGITVRGTSDVWISAQCGRGGDGLEPAAVPAVFRLGRPQEPVLLP